VRLDPGINQFFHSVADENGLPRHHDNAVEIIVEFAALLGVTADEVFSSEKLLKILNSGLVGSLFGRVYKTNYSLQWEAPFVDPSANGISSTVRSTHRFPDLDAE
jgi:hypothetical protein